MHHGIARLGTFARAWLVPALIVLAPVGAQAGLGEPEASVATDAATLDAQVNTSDLGAYRIHEMRADSGATVHEYASAGGTVFAVTWSGQHLPNLARLLGAHYAAYVKAAQSGPAGASRPHHVSVSTDDLVVEMSGHMRAYRGRAYLKSALPAGVSPEVLK